ncbi:hypothetical protein BpHYR1_004752 [Brachionus plicatilis]|uniref:Uncharacterized protein n=1 Tax=Brachionus plicatilis TaxID=10195 RepID=A0A3M7PMP3_BRAPC|nr:hypothetical protein BpHYR1_004752 [Brachionus plicatilis]
MYQKLNLLVFMIYFFTLTCLNCMPTKPSVHFALDTNGPQNKPLNLDVLADKIQEIQKQFEKFKPSKSNESENQMYERFKDLISSDKIFEKLNDLEKNKLDPSNPEEAYHINISLQ